MNNFATTLPEYQSLSFLDCRENPIETLPCYPELKILKYTRNQPSYLPYYPKLKDINGILFDFNYYRNAENENEYAYSNTFW